MRDPIIMFAVFVMLLLSACRPVQRLPAPAAADPPDATGAAPGKQMTILAQGGPLEGANGARFGPDGNLYVSSAGGSGIVAIAPETGEILQRYTFEQGVESPDDLAFGPDGSLYWTALFSGEVGRLAPDGTLTTQMLAPGVNAITFSPDGRLFVALDFMGDGLYELDPALQQPPRRIIGELGFLNAMDFGPDGLLYGPIVTQGRVVRIDVDADPPTLETVVEGMATAIAVKFDSQGRLHVLNAATGEVWRVDAASGAKDLLAQLPPGIDNLAFDASDRLFVTHNNGGFVWEVLADGSTRELIRGGMIGPLGVAVLPAGAGETVYTGNVFSLYAFDGASGAEMVAGLPAGAVSVAPFGGDLVTASWFTNGVTVLDHTTGAELAAYYDFAVPLNAIEFGGDLVVAELGTGSVVRAGGAGLSERTTLAADLAVPLGLAAREGDLWVGDLAAGAIWQIVAGGEVLAQPRLVAEGLAAPGGLALAPDGSLLVVETGKGRLIAIDPATGEIVTLAGGLAPILGGRKGAPPVLTGVAVGPSGAIYVASDGDNTLYRIGP